MQEHCRQPEFRRLDPLAGDRILPGLQAPLVTVQLLVSITRFVAVGGESWGYGSRGGGGGL